jgi:hypothetical protein
MKRRILIAILVFFAASCTPAFQDLTEEPESGSPGESVAQTVEAQPSESPPALAPTPEPAASFTPTAPSLEDAPLSAEGPWLIFTTGQGIWADAIWAVNPDGTGLTEFTVPGQHISRPRNLAAAVSPSGGYLAFITASDPNKLTGLTLNLLKLPEGVIKTVTPLSSPETEPEPGADPAQRPPEPLLALTQERSLAWAPDGRSLAFMAAFEGPSSDLYVYSMEAGTVTRLTDGPSQGIRPLWSPDGRFILHFGVNTLGTGAGYDMAGAWAARADDTEVRSLYDPSSSAEEVVLGWTGGDTFAIFSYAFGSGGPENLRTVRIETGAVEALWEGAFRDAALDPEGGGILLLVDEDAAGRNDDGAAGLYFLSPGSDPVRILEDEPSQVIWSQEAQLFFARTEFGIVAVSPGGDWNQLHDFTGRLPVSSPVDKELAWYGDAGLWVGDLISSLDLPQPEQIFTEPVLHAVWGPSGQNLPFFTEDGLYVLQKPELRPTLVGRGLSALDTIWMAP